MHNTNHNKTSQRGVYHNNYLCTCIMRPIYTHTHILFTIQIPWRFTNSLYFTATTNRIYNNIYAIIIKKTIPNNINRKLPVGQYR